MMWSFYIPPGSVIAGKYQVIARLGGGWEGEVYRIVEMATGVECAAKIFFPVRNVKNRLYPIEHVRFAGFIRGSLLLRLRKR